VRLSDVQLYVVSICLCNYCTVILVLRIARRGRLVGCLLGENSLARYWRRPCGRFTTCRGCQLGVDSRRCRVGGLFPIGFPFPFLSFRVRSLTQCDNASTVSGIEFQRGLGGDRKLDRRWNQVVWQPYWNVFLLLATYVGNCIKGVSHGAIGL